MCQNRWKVNSLIYLLLMYSSCDMHKKFTLQKIYKHSGHLFKSREEVGNNLHLGMFEILSSIYVSSFSPGVSYETNKSIIPPCYLMNIFLEPRYLL